MSKKVKFIIIILGFIIPFIVIYRSFFSHSLLAWGDGPFYYAENLKELFNKPLTWDTRNNNFGTDQSLLMWLFLPTFLFGLLNHFYHLSSEVLVRLVFYFPATILSIAGSWLFLGQFVKKNEARFLGSLLYGFNTYFLLVLDGGQIGVGLAYGVFPLTIYLIDRYLSLPNIKNYIFASLVFFSLSNIDLRVAIMAIFFLILWKLLGVFFFKKEFARKSFLAFLLIIVTVTGLDLFWLVPFIHGLIIGQGSFSNLGGSVSLISLSDSLFLFQPHFPTNQFGKIYLLPSYFLFFPLLVFIGLVFKKNSGNKDYLIFSLLFLISAFLAKGTSEPFGQVYQFVIDHVPLATSFRDSSKFFIPLIFCASVMLGYSLEIFLDFLKNTLFKKLLILTVFVYLLILIFPAINPGLTGALAFKDHGEDYQIIYQYLKKEPGFFRTLWFNERPPLAFSSWEKPALSANLLYQERPFASMIGGSYDLYNFLHSNQLKFWLDLLGVKFIFLPQDERKKVWSDKEVGERSKFLSFVNTAHGLHPLNLGTTFPVYGTSDTQPLLFAQEKAYLVVGGEDIYQALVTNKDFSLSSQGFIFVEQGNIAPEFIKKLNRDSAGIIFVHKTELDLVMSLLKDSMISLQKTKFNQWAKRASKDYLEWKNDLIQKGMRVLEFDYEKGISFSTQTGEKIISDIDVSKNGNYYLALRYTNASASAGLKVQFDNQTSHLYSNDPAHFKWDLIGPVGLQQGKSEVVIENLGGSVAVNTLALVEDKKLIENNKVVKDLLKNLNTYFISNEYELDSLSEKLAGKKINISYKQINPTKFRLQIPANVNWLVFTQHYNPNWILQDGQSVSAVPFYAMVNGFLIDKNSGAKDAILDYSPQADVNLGIFLSLLTLGVILLVILKKYLTSIQNKLD